MRVLGLDPGLMTGWAMSGIGQGKFARGTWQLEVRRQHCSLFRHLTSLSGPDLVVVEKPVGLGYNAMAANAQKVGVIMIWAEERGVPIKLVAPTTVKKFATGSGRATKEDMVKAARRRFGLVKTDHEADALWICAYGVENLCA